MVLRNADRVCLRTYHYVLTGGSPSPCRRISATLVSRSRDRRQMDRTIGERGDWCIDCLGAPDRTDHGAFLLRYGMSSHQAARIVSENNPIRVLNGEASMINYLDALNAWQLVHTAAVATGRPIAASFKHASPAGVAMGGLSMTRCARPGGLTVRSMLSSRPMSGRATAIPNHRSATSSRRTMRRALSPLSRHCAPGARHPSSQTSS